MKNFIKNMLSSDNNTSSKRTMGMLSILLYYCIFVSSYFIELSAVQITLATNILYTGSALLGLGILDKRKNGDTNR